MIYLYVNNQPSFHFFIFSFPYLIFHPFYFLDIGPLPADTNTLSVFINNDWKVYSNLVGSAESPSEFHREYHLMGSDVYTPMGITMGLPMGLYIGPVRVRGLR